MSRFDRANDHDDRLESSLLLSSAPSGREMEADLLSRFGHASDSGDPQDETLDPGIHNRRLERQRTPALHESESKALTDIGMFRVLAFEDLARHRYGGDVTRTKQELGTLSRKGLLRWRTSYPEQAVYVTLSRPGHQRIAAYHEQGNSQQRLYYGFVNTREARHDAALYRLYQQEIERIERMGGKVQRVILDFELRQSINRRLAKLASLPKAEHAQHQRDIAQEHGLKVVNGKIPLPDLRLEYQGPDQELWKVDLELVTTHYHHDMVATKAEAGFVMYAFAEDTARLRPAMQDPEIMQDILSL